MGIPTGELLLAVEPTRYKAVVEAVSLCLVESVPMRLTTCGGIGSRAVDVAVGFFFPAPGCQRTQTLLENLLKK